VVRAADDAELARYPARELTAERIRALAVGDPLPARHNSAAEP